MPYYCTPPPFSLSLLKNYYSTFGIISPRKSVFAGCSAPRYGFAGAGCSAPRYGCAGLFAVLFTVLCYAADNATIPESNFSYRVYSSLCISVLSSHYYLIRQSINHSHLVGQVGRPQQFHPLLSAEQDWALLVR